MHVPVSVGGVGSEGGSDDVVAAHEHRKEYQTWKPPVLAALLCPVWRGDAAFMWWKHSARILGLVRQNHGTPRVAARSHQ
jgi:hypothetical protein